MALEQTSEILLSGLPRHQLNQVNGNMTKVITESGTSLTLLPKHNNTWIRCTSGSAVTITFPQGLGEGFSCLLKRAGTGAVTIQGDGTSSVVNVDGFYSISGQHGIMTVFADVANIATVSGNLA